MQQTDRLRREAKCPSVRLTCDRGRFGTVATRSSTSPLPLLCGFALKPSLLRMFTAHDAVGAPQVGGVEMEKHKRVSGLVTGSRAQCGVIVFVAAVCIHTPFIWTLWHEDKPSAPHKNELPSAENSGSENTSPTVDKALVLKSPPMKSTLCCFMYPRKRRRNSVEASRFLATTLWMCTEQNVTVGVPEREGRR